MLARNRYEVSADVRRLISETLAIPMATVTEDTLVAEELQATSMDIVTLTMTFDDFFGVEFDLSELPSSNVSVRWLVDYIFSRTGSE